MNGRREDINPSSCYFHPEDNFIGVCPLCLHERLLILASRQKQLRRRRTDPGDQSRPSTDGRNPINLPKIFALGSFLNRLEFRHYWRSDSVDLDRDASTTAEDDSFISIKFEDNGVSSWEKKNTATAAAAAATTNSKVSLDNCNISWNHQSLNKVDPTKTTTTTTTNNKCVIEHVKPRTGSLRWRKRIGHMFHLIRWKRSSKASVCHVGAKVEGVKVRNNGWIRTLTKRRAKE